MVCVRNISVDTLHKGDTEDGDDDDNNNNNNTIIIIIIIIVINDFRHVGVSSSSSHCKRQRINREMEAYFLCIFPSFKDKKEWVHPYA